MAVSQSSYTNPGITSPLSLSQIILQPLPPPSSASASSIRQRTTFPGLRSSAVGDGRLQQQQQKQAYAATPIASSTARWPLTTTSLSAVALFGNTIATTNATPNSRVNTTMTTFPVLLPVHLNGNHTTTTNDSHVPVANLITLFFFALCLACFVVVIVYTEYKDAQETPPVKLPLLPCHDDQCRDRCYQTITRMTRGQQRDEVEGFFVATAAIPNDRKNNYKGEEEWEEPEDADVDTEDAVEWWLAQRRVRQQQRRIREKKRRERMGRIMREEAAAAAAAGVSVVVEDVEGRRRRMI